MKHGLSKYKHDKCPCEVCRGANAAAQARHRAKRTDAQQEAQRAANRAYYARKKQKNSLQKRIDSAVPNDWTW